MKKLSGKLIGLLVAAAVVIIGGGTVLGLYLTGNVGGLSQQEAKQAALSHAGVQEADLTSLQIRSDHDDGAAIYEVDFSTAERRYSYEVKKRNGDIVQADYETIADAAAPSDDMGTDAAPAGSDTQQSQGAISAAEARAIALEHAGVAEADAQFVREKEDYDDGRAVYEIEFYAGNTEYDYEIAKDTGEIISVDHDMEAALSGNSTGEALTQEQAQELALEKVPGAGANDIRISYERDDGRQIYEGEIYYNGTEYEFEMDAVTGDFIEWSTEKH